MRGAGAIAEAQTTIDGDFPHFSSLPGLAGSHALKQRDGRRTESPLEI